MFIFVLILCLKKTSMLSLRHCKVNHYFSDYQVFTVFFFTFLTVLFFLLAYLCVFFLFLLNLVYFMILDKRKVGAS